MSLEAKSFQLALNYATWSYNGYNGCTDCRVLAVYTGYTVCHVLRPQNKMSSPREVLWTYARGVHPFELDREEILISEEFRKRQETVKWRGFDTFRVGKKNEKWGMFPVPHTEDFKSQLNLAVSKISEYPLFDLFCGRNIPCALYAYRVQKTQYAGYNGYNGYNDRRETKCNRYTRHIPTRGASCYNYATWTTAVTLHYAQ